MTQTTTTTSPPEPPVTPSGRAWRRAPIGPILLIWAVLTALLLLFAVMVPARLMGVVASGQMREIQSTVTAFSVAAAPVAGLVWAVALYSLFGWRHGGPDAPQEIAPPLRRHAGTEIVWLVISSFLCLFLLVWGLVVLEPEGSQANEAAAPVVVNVTGQQWTWTFSYPSVGDLETTDIYLPVDTPVQFNVTSKDVVHSFWIVEMGIKVDANPGETTHVGVTPNRVGTFTVRCAELCGLYHSYMQTSVHVLSKSDYDAWASSQPHAAT